MNLRVLLGALVVISSAGPALRAAAPADPAQVLEQALAGADPASLESVIQEGLRKDPGHSPDWKLLELWRLSETGKDPAFDSALATFRGSAPGNRRLEYADWLQVRSLARRGALAQSGRVACTLLLKLDPASPLRPRVLEFARDLVAKGLDADGRRELALWLGDEKRARLPELELIPRLYHRIGAVLPLRGADGKTGRELQAGLLAAMEAHGSDGGPELVILDCESDALLARHQMQELSASGVDVIIVPGEPAYAAAAAFGAPQPMVFPWYSGEGLAGADSSFHQFNTPASYKLDRLVALAREDLHLERLGSLVPANRAGNQLQDRLEALAAGGGLELAPPEWYLPGTMDARRQVENLGIFATSYPEGDGLVILPLPADGPMVIPQLAAGNPDAWLLGDGVFMEGENPDRLSVFRDRLVIVGDWLPGEGLDGFEPFRSRTLVLQNREPARNEALGFETARLLLLAGDMAAAEGVSFAVALSRLRVPSAYGGEFHLENRANLGLRTLGWNGVEFTPWGGR